MPQLPGEAPEGRYSFEDLDGNRVEGREGVSPILERVNQQWRFIGTAFFIAQNGIFATAKHVIQEAWSDDRDLFICQFIGQREYVNRAIAYISWHNMADVAVGTLVPAIHEVTGEPLINTSLRLTALGPRNDDYVATYAYPKTSIQHMGTIQRRYFDAGFYEGKVEEYFPNGCGLLRGPCYRTSMVIHAGASGGPVGSASGRTFAVNSTGFEGTEISHISRIDEILDLAVPLNCNDIVRSVPIRELAQEGIVAFDPPI